MCVCFFEGKLKGLEKSQDEGAAVDENVFGQTGDTTEDDDSYNGYDAL